MKEIEIQGEKILVDDNKYELVKQLPLYLSDHNRIRIKTMTLSRFLLGITDLKIEVDHKNRNRLDHRIANLRACTRTQNLQNRGKQKNNTSGYKGVWMCRGMWVAQIRANKKKYVSRQFATPIEAAMEYDRMAKKYHGEYAVLNFS